MDARFLQAFRFFRENAGGIVGQNAICAFELAKAEEYARAREWEIIWYEDDGWFGDTPRDWGWSEKECEEWDRRNHTYEGCTLRDNHGEWRAGLGGIWDADANYRRVVAAELASEAMRDDFARRPTFGYRGN